MLQHRHKALYTLAGLGLLVFSLGVLGWLLYQQRDILVTYEWSFRWPAALASFVLFSLDLLLVALIWAWIMNAMGGAVTLRKHLRYYYLSHLARRLPGTVWYVIGRAYFYKQDGIMAGVTSVASGVELVVMTMSGLVIALFLVISNLLRDRASLWALAALLLPGLLILHPRVVRGLMYRLGKGEQISAFSYGDLLKWLLAYGVVWALGGLTLFAVGNTITVVEIKHLPFIIGSWSAAGVGTILLFFVPGKIGFAEVSLSLLLATIMPAPIAIVLALVTRLLLLLYEIVWAVIVYFGPVQPE